MTDRQLAYIHNLNNFIYNLTTHHSDVLQFFDINKFIGFNLRERHGSIYLPKKYRHRIATLIASNILFSLSNEFSSKPTVIKVNLNI